MLKQKFNEWALVNTLGMLTKSLLSWISHQELAGLRPPRKVIDKPNLMPCPEGLLQTGNTRQGSLQSSEWDNLLGLCVGGVGGVPVFVFPNHILAEGAEEEVKSQLVTSSFSLYLLTLSSWRSHSQSCKGTHLCLLSQREDEKRPTGREMGDTVIWTLSSSIPESRPREK